MKRPDQYFIFALLAATLLLTSACKNDITYSVRPEYVALSSLDEITPVLDSLVIPKLYENVRGLEAVPSQLAREKFIAALLPAVLVARHERETDRLRLQKLQAKERWSELDSIRLRHLLSRYNVRDIDDLPNRMMTMPNSLVLAQAIIETGWGTSRFFVEARNVFGIWSFSENDNRIEAHAVRGDQKVYLRAYNDLSGSVRDYLNVLSSSNAFRGLRVARMSTENPFELLPYLKNYSERRMAYTRLVEKVIVQNNLTRFDRYTIHPDFLEEDEWN